MFVALCRIDFHVPASHSLKAKRSVLQRLKGRLIQRFQASVAEVAFQDRWQRGRLGVALVGGSPAYLQQRLQEMRRLVDQVYEVQILDWVEDVHRFETEGLGLEAGGRDEAAGSDDDDEPGDWDWTSDEGTPRGRS
ncbi:MAG: DUF503 family protein [Candidatus Eisenbacteria bacterium]|nr:DUF503 family protein [Candidatus Eisenbacteria bacterium]